MPVFVALLKGVNVGQAKRIPMAAFRALLASLGYLDVRTLLNSGNAIFRGADVPQARHAAAIHDALVATLGLDVQVVVKSSRDWHAIVRENTLAADSDDPSRLLVVFAQSHAAIDALRPLERGTPPERFVVGRHAAYLRCPDGVLSGQVGSALLGKAGRDVTTRNWTTVGKLTALLAEVEDR